jgi:ElaB/YqjD/DUF883 family membrane-anchored ribosome-binding protein
LRKSLDVLPVMPRHRSVVKWHQAEGSVQDLYGQAKDAAGEAINAVGKMPASLEDTIRHYIQNRPYTTAAIALALGWLIGRSHRPF